MQHAVAHRPFVAASGRSQRHAGSQPLQQQSRRGQLQLARATPFEEGRRQVRRLVDRDRKEMNLDELEATFSEEATVSRSAPATPSSAAEADGDSAAAAPPPPPAAGTAPRSPFIAAPDFQATSSASDKTPVSPFGPAVNNTVAPSRSFVSSSGPGMKRPFAEPAGLSPNMPTPLKDTTPWWTKITMTQIVITASFTTIIALMVGTFFFVLSTGAIRFNE